VGNEHFVSPWSNETQGVPCKKAVTGDAIGIEIVFESVELVNVHDGFGDTMEVYGHFFASPSSGWAVNQQGRLMGELECEAEDLPCLRRWSDGNHPLAAVPLCPFPPSGCEGDLSRYVVNNNRIYLPVKGGDPIWLYALLLDNDDPNAPNWFCFVQHTTEAKSVVEWASTDTTLLKLDCGPDEDFDAAAVYVTYRALP
jgi:hypothetical protein